MAVIEVTHSLPGAQGRCLRAHAATKSALSHWPLATTQNQLCKAVSEFLRALCGKGFFSASPRLRGETFSGRQNGGRP